MYLNEDISRLKEDTRFCTGGDVWDGIRDDGMGEGPLIGSLAPDFVKAPRGKVL